MRNKTINELTGLENPRLTDTLPIWDGTEGKTKKVSLAKIPANVITPVDSLPESPNILDRVYRYNNKYYVGNESAQTLTELASKADIPTVVDTVADGNMHPVTSNAVYDKLQAFLKLTVIRVDSNQFIQNPNYPQCYDISISIPTPPEGYTTCIGGVLGVAWFSNNIYCPLEIYDRIRAPENGVIPFTVCAPDMTTIQNTVFRLVIIWSK